MENAPKLGWTTKSCLVWKVKGEFIWKSKGQIILWSNSNRVKRHAPFLFCYITQQPEERANKTKKSKLGEMVWRKITKQPWMQRGEIKNKLFRRSRVKGHGLRWKSLDAWPLTFLGGRGIWQAWSESRHDDLACFRLRVMTGWNHSHADTGRCWASAGKTWWPLVWEMTYPDRWGGATPCRLGDLGGGGAYNWNTSWVKPLQGHTI